MPEVWCERRTCRLCGATNLERVLSLGNVPSANALVTEGRLADLDPLYPLTLAFCRKCALAQILLDVPPAQVFGADYPYFTSYSGTLMDHGKELVESAFGRRRISPGDLVLEVGANDGYLLELFDRAGCRTLGVEPAEAQATAARARGVEVVQAFFGLSVAQELRDGGARPRLIVANNVMAHVPELADFARSLRTLVADDGWVSIENPWVRDLLARCEYDTIYDEHRSYFSTMAIQQLLLRHDLSLVDVEYFPDLHGGTLRWWARPGRWQSERSVEEILRAERAAGLGEVDPYVAFAAAARSNIAAVSTMVSGLRNRGKRVAAYGAAAKGTMLLNLCRLGPASVEYVVDRNPVKQSKWIPGVRVPIREPGLLLRDMPEYVLLLAWNLEAEVAQQEAEFLRRGGKLIVPVPSPRVRGSR